MAAEYLDRDMISEYWGEDFLPLAENHRVKFGMDSIFVTLKSPVKNVDGEETKVVELKEPTVAVMKSIDGAKGEVTKAAVLLASMSGVPNASFNTVKASDFMLLNKVVAAFLSDGPETGKK